MIFEEIARNTDHFCSDFKTDRDVRMFLTLYFWKYLCYFANIDFYTGQDKTEEILKGEADQFGNLIISLKQEPLML